MTGPEIALPSVASKGTAAPAGTGGSGVPVPRADLLPARKARPGTPPSIEVEG